MPCVSFIFSLSLSLSMWIASCFKWIHALHTQIYITHTMQWRRRRRRVQLNSLLCSTVWECGALFFDLSSRDLICLACPPPQIGFDDGTSSSSSCSVVVLFGCCLNCWLWRWSSNHQVLIHSWGALDFEEAVVDGKWLVERINCYSISRHSRLNKTTKECFWVWEERDVHCNFLEGRIEDARNGVPHSWFPTTMDAKS